MSNASVSAQVVFVLGGPGAGKGTQCANIVRDYGFVHLSAGDLLREERKSGSDTAELIQSCISKGSIVPVAITVNLIRKAMQGHLNAKVPKSRFLIDGFPRNEDNLQGWEKEMNGFADVKFVLFIDCDEETMEKRCLKRAGIEGRSDDNEKTIRLRYNTFVNETRPIIEKFEKSGLVRKIDSRPAADIVYDSIKKAFDNFFSRSE